MYKFDNNLKYLSSINKFLPKPEKSWQYDDKCYNCNIIFGYFQNRQHHCRVCGRCFCINCTGKMIVPEYYTKAPPEQQTYIETAKIIKGYISKVSKEKTVCKDCVKRLNYLIEIYPNIKIFGYCDIDTIKKLLFVSKKYYHAGIYYLYNYEMIKYKNICNYTKWDIQSLKINKCSVDYVKYIIYQIYNNEILDDDAIDILQKSNTEFNMYDFLEILLFINKCDDEKYIFWMSAIKNIFDMFVKKIKIDNNDVLYNCIFIRKIIFLFNNKYEKNNIDNNITYNIFKLLAPNSTLLNNVINEILKLDIKDNYILEYLKLFSLENKDVQYYDHEEFKNIKKMYAFLYNKLYSANNYNWHRLEDYNKNLPILYPFDYNYNITKIIGFYQINDYKLGIFGNKHVKLEITSKKNINDVKEVSIIFHGCPDKRDYENYLFTKMIYKTLNYDGPINDMTSIKNNIFIVKIENDIVSLSELYNNKMDIKDYIYGNNIDVKLNEIIKKYSDSLGMMIIMSNIFNISIMSYNDVVMNKNGEIYFSKFYNDGNKDYDYNFKYIDILGTKNGNIYKNFINQTQHKFHIVKKNVRPSLLYNMYKEDDIFDNKNIFSIL